MLLPRSAGSSAAESISGLQQPCNVGVMLSDSELNAEPCAVRTCLDQSDQDLKCRIRNEQTYGAAQSGGKSNTNSVKVTGSNPP